MHLLKDFRLEVGEQLVVLFLARIRIVCHRFRGLLGGVLSEADSMVALALQRKDVRKILVRGPIFVITNSLSNHFVGLALVFVRTLLAVFSRPRPIHQYHVVIVEKFPR